MILKENRNSLSLHVREKGIKNKKEEILKIIESNDKMITK